MRYFIGGVNGSGKTTLVLKVKEILSDFEIIKGSKAFMEFLGLGSDYEALRSYPHEDRLRKLEELMRKLTSEYKNLILDSQYLNLVRGKVKKVTGDWIKEFDALILLEVDPRTALHRIEGDIRDRALFSSGSSEKEKLRVYTYYIREYRREFETLVNRWHLPYKVIDGAKTPSEVVSEFVNFDTSLRVQQ